MTNWRITKKRRFPLPSIAVFPRLIMPGHPLMVGTESKVLRTWR